MKNISYFMFLISLSQHWLTSVAYGASSQVTSSQSIARLADSLTQLRSEVEDLHSQLEESRSLYKGELTSQSQRLADLDTQIQRHQLSRNELAKKIDAKLSLLKTNIDSGVNMKPALEDAVNQLERYVTSSLPFKLESRIKVIQELKVKWDDPEMTSQKIVSQIWSLFDDELRLQKEIGLHQQVIQIEGDEHLVDVVKVGMMMLYFKTQDDKYGQAVKTDGKYQFVLEKDNDSEKAIDELFQAVKMNIRTGVFDLPVKIAYGENGVSQ